MSVLLNLTRAPFVSVLSFVTYPPLQTVTQFLNLKMPAANDFSKNKTKKKCPIRSSVQNNNTPPLHQHSSTIKTTLRTFHLPTLFSPVHVKDPCSPVHKK